MESVQPQRKQMHVASLGIPDGNNDGSLASRDTLIQHPRNKHLVHSSRNNSLYITHPSTRLPTWDRYGFTRLQQNKPTKNVPNRIRKSQSRTDKFLSRLHNDSLRRKYRDFSRGSRRFIQNLPSTVDDIRNTDANLRQHDMAQYHVPLPDIIPDDDHRLQSARSRETREIRQLVELLDDGGVGFLPRTKSTGYTRIMYENWNSLGIGSVGHSWKIDRINQLSQSLDIDIICGVETQCNWDMVPATSQFCNIIGRSKAKKGISGHNIHEKICRDQQGGTAIMALGRLTEVIIDLGTDTSGLGRWSWIRVGTNGVTTRIVTAYMPCKPRNNSAGKTVWDQHRRFFHSKGDFRRPSDICLHDLLSFLRDCRSLGDEIVLCIDANENIYTGRLATELQRAPLNMCCLVKSATGSAIPPTHQRGSQPIDCIAGTPGIIADYGMVYPFYYGVGDHRILVVELSSSSLFGHDFPSITKQESRLINSKIPRCRRMFNSSLTKLCGLHKMSEKLEKTSYITDPDKYSKHHNRWDTQLGGFIRHAEKQCTKVRGGDLEFSPTVGMFLRRRNILRWILRWHDNKKINVCNLLRAAKRNGIDSPLLLSRDEVQLRLNACVEEMYTLRQDAPDLRRRHIIHCLNRARRNGDQQKAQEIAQLRHREEHRKRSRRIRSVIKGNSMKQVFMVRTDHATEGETLLTRQEDIVAAGAEHFSSRFRLGARAPCNKGQLFADLGHLSDTVAAEKILSGDYIFPETCDIGTRAILTVASELHLAHKDVALITSDTTLYDFQSFWRRANQRTQSSFSGRHFDVYISMSHDDYLSSLQVSSINLAASRGLPLHRWQSAVTCMLEKVTGTNHLEKLRAICLLEADYNWWCRVKFARDLMSRMRECDIMPAEQFASQGRNTTDAVIMKQLFYDYATILHVDAAVCSVDAANCYDSVHHAIASLSCQSLGLALSCCLLMLRTMQSITFYIKTGFGVSPNGFGGSHDNPSYGLGQGSCSAPASWTGVSTLIVNAYRRSNFGVTMRGAWSDTSLQLAAILYVDDTDLLHLSSNPYHTLEQFVIEVQNATWFWGLLLQATGGSLKPSKCFWYLASYHFPNGRACLRQHKSIAHNLLTIPQHDGGGLAIRLLDAKQEEETLGIFSCPAGTNNKQLEKMLQKGMTWTHRARSPLLPRQDKVHSFWTQALMSVRYGLAALMCPPDQLESTIQKWYYASLPLFGIERNITKEWRDLPIQFQGLGLPNFAIEKLADSIHFIHRHWDMNNSIGRALRIVFELVQIETGLEGNFVTRDYSTLGCLASPSWWKVIWQYCSQYGVTLELTNTRIPPIRIGDVPIMECILRHDFCQDDVVSINIVRHFKQVYFLSDLVCCDGTSLLPDIWKCDTTVASSYTFPRECPTAADFAVWNTAIDCIFGTTRCLTPRLGPFLRLPPRHTHWKTNISRDSLTLCGPHNHATQQFQLIGGRRITRRGRLFQKQPSTNHPESDSHLATVLVVDQNTVTLHSCAPLPQPTKRPMLSPRDIISHMANQTLWNTLDLDGDGCWITDSIRSGSLVCCHDGSFMGDLDPAVCSAAGLLLCRSTGKVATISVAEQSNIKTASNYRAEILGGLMVTLILQAATTDRSIQYSSVEVFCDNIGVVRHGNDSGGRLKEGQAQLDVLRALKLTVSSLPCTVRFSHVYGHADSHTDWDGLTPSQQLNVLCDAQAKSALLKAIATSSFIISSFPGETVCVGIQGRKITADIRDNIYAHWGYGVAKELYHARGIIHRSFFDLVDWTALQHTMTRYSKQMRIWVTKHVSHFCGTNRRLSQMGRHSSITNHCPCCGMADENTHHIVRCKDPGRTQIFHECVADLVQWLQSSGCEDDLTLLIEAYLLSRGDSKLCELLQNTSPYSQFVADQDNVGWDNFVEGRVVTSLFGLMHKRLTAIGSRLTILSWSHTFIRLLIAIPHKQWCFRNTRLHLPSLEGKTCAQHKKIIDRVKHSMTIDPDALLPQHRSLLEVDYRQLGSGSTTDRQIWLADIDSAISAAAVLLSAGGKRRSRNRGIPPESRHNLAKKARLA